MYIPFLIINIKKNYIRLLICIKILPCFEALISQIFHNSQYVWGNKTKNKKKNQKLNLRNYLAFMQYSKSILGKNSLRNSPGTAIKAISNLKILPKTWVEITQKYHVNIVLNIKYIQFSILITNSSITCSINCFIFYAIFFFS